MATVLHRLQSWAVASPRSVAQRTRKNGQWEGITAKDFRDNVFYLAGYLESLGINQNSCSAIFSYNCPEWVHLDLAALLVKAKSAGLYPNSNAKDIEYVLNHTEAQVLGVQNKEYFDKIVDSSGRSLIPSSVKKIIVFSGECQFSPLAISYSEALIEGKKYLENKFGNAFNLEKEFQNYLDCIDPQAPAFMIYTSGTTGNPKGALLSHDNLTYTSDLVVQYWKLPFARGSLFSFLPLCHIAEKLQNVGVGITQRYTVSFCTQFDQVAVELPEVEPTLLLCVPRLWEKMMEGVMNKVNAGKGAKKQLALWALGVGKDYSQLVLSRKNLSSIQSIATLAQYRLADKLVLSKVRKALGLGKAELLASGAAALPAHVSNWFRCIGLEILEDFGQTESTGVICMTESGLDCSGTVGKPVPGVEFKLADDGEILTKGRHVFIGYYKDEAATQKTLVDGWLLTGDLGQYDLNGRVVIKGRNKEIIKTSGGKMIAPVPVEEKLKVSEIVSQACIVGEGRKYLTVLITLGDAAMANLKSKGKKAISDDALIVLDEEILANVQSVIDDVNKDLASFEQIKKFAVLSREFSIQEEEMTPTLKMKRNVIEKRFQNIINKMYE